MLQIDKSKDLLIYTCISSATDAAASVHSKSVLPHETRWQRFTQPCKLHKAVCAHLVCAEVRSPHVVSALCFTPLFPFTFIFLLLPSVGVRCEHGALSYGAVL
uniref:Uncharacterized protein n=1 Tax=Rhipicephalus zambeziensis TaxID=60191 RepID=A0A224Y747_9ACAR